MFIKINSWQELYKNNYYLKVYEFMNKPTIKIFINGQQITQDELKNVQVNNKILSDIFNSARNRILNDHSQSLTIN